MRCPTRIRTRATTSSSSLLRRLPAPAGRWRGGPPGAQKRSISRRRAPRPAAKPSPITQPDHVPADVARAVWERDHGCCAWKLENGQVCGSTYQLELDHIDGWALGAGMTVEELRLLCKHHQDVHARALYGDALMNRYTRPKGPGCSEPVASYAPCTAGERTGP